MAEKVLNVADKETLDLINEKIGATSDTGGTVAAGTVNAKLNAVLDTTGQQKSKLDTVLTILGSGTKEFTSAGNYSVEIPAGITKIKVTAAAGGGAGCSFFIYKDGRYNFGSAGSGGCCIVDQEFTLDEHSSPVTIPITVGNGGTARKSSSENGTYLKGNNGGATIIGDLITLAGGKAGEPYNIDGNDTNNTLTSSETASAGSGSGKGGASKARRMRNTAATGSVTGNKGTDGLIGTAGEAGTAQNLQTGVDNYFLVGAGSGGGSLGNGGSGKQHIRKADGTYSQVNAVNPTRGGGGYAAGEFCFYANSSAGVDRLGGSGADGYVKITWGV